MNKKTTQIKINKNDKLKNVATDQFIPDDEKIPVKQQDPEDLPEEDPYENSEEEPPTEGEGP